MDTYLTYDQISEKLGIKKSTLYALVSQKRIPHIRLSGRCVRFNESEVENWLKNLKVDVTNAE